MGALSTTTRWRVSDGNGAPQAVGPALTPETARRLQRVAMQRRGCVMRTILRTSVLTMAVLGVAIPAARAQTARSSSDVAPALAALLDARELDAFAAPDPATPGRFVAVMYLKGSQLLIVGAKYSVPSFMHDAIEAGRFRDAYMDLQGASEIQDRWFIQDLGVDGLKPTRMKDTAFDVVYKDAVDYVVLDGDWQAQSLSEADYRQRFSTADERYVRMLTVLVNALRAQS